eukprot:SAG31_NODE_1073_length_10065_cov_2.176701_9_plen_96_part_00
MRQLRQQRDFVGVLEYFRTDLQTKLETASAQDELLERAAKIQLPAKMLDKYAKAFEAEKAKEQVGLRDPRRVLAVGSVEPFLLRPRLSASVLCDC